MKKIFTLICLAFALNASAQHGLYVGGDISMLPEYEAKSSGYLDGNGNKIPDLLTWFVNDCGWNTFRVRLFVNPTDPNHEGVVQDLDYVKALGKRIKDAGAKFCLDFHYSDTWADPTKQYLPSAWSDCTTVDQKAGRLYQYTKETLAALKAAGAEPDLVQVGNEITSGIIGVWRKDNATGFKTIVEKGCDAVREACPNAKIIIHIERPQNTNNVVAFYSALDQSKYDVIGLSYYPIWHGNLSDLAATLKRLKTSFASKKVQIVETAYNFQYWPTLGVTYDTRSTWDCSANGQYKFVKDLIAELANHDNVDGLYYWFPEEAGSGDYANWNTMEGVVLGAWVNRGLWWLTTTTTGHWPVKADEGMVAYLMKTFLDPDATGISMLRADRPKPSEGMFSISGQRISAPAKHGIYINNGKKVISNN